MFFGYVRDVANASKHQELTRDNLLIKHVENINESIILIRHQDRDGYYYSTRKAVTVETLEGYRLLIEEFILLSILSFSNILIEVGAIPNLPCQGIKKRIFAHRRNEVDKLPKIIMGGNVGEKFKVTLASFIHEPSPVFELRGLQPGDEFNATSSSIDQIIEPPFFRE